jgi:AcrR family transcriptional regulator
MSMGSACTTQDPPGDAEMSRSQPSIKSKKMGASKTRERRPAERPDEIAQAALKLFCAKGYNSTTIDEIAAAAGITKGAVYHHFDSKEVLLESAMTTFFDRALQQATADVSKLPFSDAASRVRAIVSAAFDLWITAEFASVFCIVFGEAGKAVPRLREHFLKHGPFRGWDALAAALRDGQRQGTFRSDLDADVLARAIASGLGMQCILLSAAGYSRARLQREFETTLSAQLKLLHIA